MSKEQSLEIRHDWLFKGTIRKKALTMKKPLHQLQGARIEAIRILIAFAAYMEFKLYQMDVKSVFLNGYLKEEVYVMQPPGFENTEFPNHVFKLDKALYGLKQAPRAWYERLSNFLLENDFRRGKVDTTLFLKTKGNIYWLFKYMSMILFLEERMKTFVMNFQK